MMEVIRWISLVLLWVAMGLNVYVTVRGVRLNKRLRKLLEERPILTNNEK